MLKDLILLSIFSLVFINIDSFNFNENIDKTNHLNNGRILELIDDFKDKLIRWKEIEDGTFIFSAFLDVRFKEYNVKVLGVESVGGSSLKYCQLWDHNLSSYDIVPLKKVNISKEKSR